VTLLSSEAFYLRDGHPFHAQLSQGVFDFFEFERLDDGFDLFHADFGKCVASGGFDEMGFARSATVMPPESRRFYTEVFRRTHV
jgi:hypothetical protein